MKSNGPIWSAPHPPRGFFRKLEAAAWLVTCVAVWVGLLSAWAWSESQPAAGKTQTQPIDSPKTLLPPPPDVAAPSAKAETTASGVFFTVLARGRGDGHPAENDCVRLRFTGWKRDGSLFSTSGIHGETLVQCMNNMMPGIFEALEAMTVGEKLRVWVPANLTFGKKHHHGRSRMDLDDVPPPNVDLTFDVELVELMKAPPVPADLQAPAGNAAKTPSGLAFQILKNGSGMQHPSMTSQVTLHYSGWTSDGKLFESTAMSGHPAIFHVGTTLPAWREVLPQMVVGEKLRLWVPAVRAYGDKPVNHEDPAGNLVYDIELLAFE